MTEKKSDLYLLYAIVEIVLVVLGILIALQVNNQKVYHIAQGFRGMNLMVFIKARSLSNNMLKNFLVKKSLLPS